MVVDAPETRYCPIIMEDVPTCKGETLPCCGQFLSRKAWKQWVWQKHTCPLCVKPLRETQPGEWKVDHRVRPVDHRVRPRPDDRDQESPFPIAWNEGMEIDEDEWNEPSWMDLEEHEEEEGSLMVDGNEFRPRWSSEQVDRLMKSIQRTLRRGGSRTGRFQDLGECNILNIEETPFADEEDAETCWTLTVEPCFDSPFWHSRPLPEDGTVLSSRVVCHEHNVVNTDRFEVY